MKPVVILRHAANEGPGYLADFLKVRDIPYKIVQIDGGEAVPTDPESASAWVFMGGPMSVNDDLPWIPQSIQLIQKAISQDMPILGFCLGGQLIARALGAAITQNPVPEFGWLPIEVCHRQEASGWLQGVEHSFEAFHWHGETFALPNGATRILASAHCHNQGFIYGKALALQCHIEMTEALVDDWITHNTDRPAPSNSVQSAGAMRERLPQRLQVMQRQADHLFEYWLGLIA